MAAAARPSNATILARLGDGKAKFELLEGPAPAPPSWRGGWNKVERYGVRRVTGDGRCMFRALVKGMAKSKGIPLTPREEVQDAGSCLGKRYKMQYHGRGDDFIPIVEYGLEFTKNSKEWKKTMPVRLLYSRRNHYDLLI